MRYLVALVLLWGVPGAVWFGLPLIDGLVSPELGYLAIFVGGPLAFLLTLVVLPAMLLGDAGEAWDRRGRRDRGRVRPGR